MEHKPVRKIDPSPTPTSRTNIMMPLQGQDKANNKHKNKNVPFRGVVLTVHEATVAIVPGRRHHSCRSVSPFSSRQLRCNAEIKCSKPHKTTTNHKRLLCGPAQRLLALPSLLCVPPVQQQRVSFVLFHKAAAPDASHVKSSVEIQLTLPPTEHSVPADPTLSNPPKTP